MLSRLLTILFSSWITTPLILWFAQVNHFANIEIVQLVLLTLAAQTPLLLLFNECITPSYIKYRSATPQALIRGTLALQAITIYASLILSGRSAFEPAVLVATALATWSSMITLIQARKVITAALHRELTFQGSFALGAIPSISLLFLYLAYQYLINGDVHEFLLLHLILPALAYQCLSRKLSAPIVCFDKPSRQLLQLTLIAGIMLLILTAINVKIRAELGASVPQYSSIILGVLNISSALFLTFSKVSHITSTAKKAEPFSLKSILPAVTVSLLILVIPVTHNPAIATLKFLVLQLALIHALMKFRSIWNQNTASAAQHQSA